MMFIWLIVLIPLVIYLIAAPGEGWGCREMPHAAPAQGTVPAHEDPVAIVRRRLARGEITSAEYEEIRRRLG